MKVGHIIKADLTRFIHSSGSRTVNTQIIWTVPFTSANTRDKIRLPETAGIPVGKVLRNTKYWGARFKHNINTICSVEIYRINRTMYEDAPPHSIYF